MFLDKDGKPIENLKKEDFELYEDGKLQKLQAVDFQKLQSNILPPVSPNDTLVPPAPKTFNPDADKAAARTNLLTKFQDRRLIVLLFDFSSMQPAEQARARDGGCQLRTRPISGGALLPLNPPLPGRIGQRRGGWVTPSRGAP